MSNIAITKGGGLALQPSNMTEAMQFAEMLARSEMVPKQYKGKPQDTLVAMMMGYEVGLNPIQSLQNIAVINGKPSIYGDAALALAQNHPAFGGIDETFDDQSMTATCIAWRKGSSKQTRSFSQTDAQKAGLWGKAGPWTQYPKRMLQMRARGFALRDAFADAMAGLVTREEAEDMPVDITDRSEVVERTREPARLPEFPDDRFQAAFPSYRKGIEEGRKTAQEVITMVETRWTMTDAQKRSINAIKPQAAEPKTEGETP